MMGRQGAGFGMNPHMGMGGWGYPGFGMGPQMGMGPWGFPGFGMSPQMGMGFSPAAFAAYCQSCGMPTTGMTPAMGMGPGMGMQGGGFWPGYGMMGQPYAGQWTPGFGWGHPGPTYGGTYTGYLTGQYGMASDDQIRDMVYDSIDADPTVPSNVEVSIDVRDGIVTLSGTVPSKRVKHALGDAAWWIPSVVDVNNAIKVAPRKRGEETQRGRASGQTGTKQTPR